MKELWLHLSNAVPWATLLTLAWAAYLAILSGWIALQKREPLATLTWILALAALPYLGFVVYYFLGPQRLRKHRLRRLRAQTALYAHADVERLLRQTDVAPPLALAQLARLGTAACDFPVATATRVELLVDGARTYEAIFEAIRAAHSHIHLEYYIFEPDRIGTALRDLLIERARVGVKVRLLIDALGSQRIGRRFLAPLLAAGAQVARFHDPRIGRRLRPVTNFRTHRKIVVCDGVIGFTGGINVTDEEDPRTNSAAYHDVHLLLAGSIVHWLQLTFLEDWSYAKRGLPHALVADLPRLLPALETGPHPVQIVTSGPDNELEPIHRMHLAAINAARQRAWLTTPYFVPGEPALMALTSAALRGVDVRLLVPARSDSRVVSAAARSYFDQLITAGVKVWEYHARMLHSKTLVVDDDCAIVGTANFDNRSFRLNFEVSAVVYGPALAQPLADQFRIDLGSASQVRVGRRRPFVSRLSEALARLLSPLL